MVAFFTSYSYMQEVVRKWEEMEILSALLKHKLIFIETTDVLETTLALEHFKRACDAGRRGLVELAGVEHRRTRRRRGRRERGGGRCTEGEREFLHDDVPK